MHIYFSGIGGTGIGPLALIASQAGFIVSGSDKQESEYIAYLRKKGLDIAIGQDGSTLEALHTERPIDWVVYSSALPKENPEHPELVMSEKLGIKSSKRDDFINFFLQEKKLKLIAIAGTHGKTTTTAMTIWLMKELGIAISYAVGAKLSFGEMGEYDPSSAYFIYEADEYDRNFLSFSPYLSIISGIDYDHPDIYPTRENYYQAFSEFIDKSRHIIAHQTDLEKLGLTDNTQHAALDKFKLTGKVNRENAQLVVDALLFITKNLQIEVGEDELVAIMNRFPGVSRRFEKVAEGIYSDYAHTPEKIRGALQLAQEVAGDNVVVVYEGLHNTRQHFIKEDLEHLFAGTKKLYIVPSYRAREDESLEDLTPEKLYQIIQDPKDRQPAKLNKELRESITQHVKNSDLVLCLTAGGGGSLDEWLRQTFIN